MEGTRRKIYTVSELNSEIRILLEKNFPFVWVSGEISNFSVPVSGHFYFTLKDRKSQISAVMFRGQNRHLKYMPEEGMRVTGMGRLGVYEPRGTYQIIFEHLEPKGLGQLQAAFDQLKARLAAEGLFDTNRKKPLPFLPRTIALVTSPAGAVVHDILNILYRRYPNVRVQIVPVRVQGPGAEREISEAVGIVNHRKEADLAILARGGGSLEDLQAFNSETVARAVCASKIPIVSAVGHETDYTIADFAADLRAPTPSAAAELVTPVKIQLERAREKLNADLIGAFYGYIDYHRSRLDGLSKRLVHPGKKLRDMRLRIDDLSMRMAALAQNHARRKREDLAWRVERLHANNPLFRMRGHRDKIESLRRRLASAVKSRLEGKKAQFRESEARLRALSPAAILARGYSIARTVPEGKILRNADSARVGREIEVTLAKGALQCRVEGKKAYAETDETNI